MKLGLQIIMSTFIVLCVTSGCALIPERMPAGLEHERIVYEMWSRQYQAIWPIALCLFIGSGLLSFFMYRIYKKKYE